MPSGFGEVTRWPPRTLWSAPRTASRPAPWLSRSWRPSPPTSRTPSRRCSVETYSSPSRRASSSASSRTRFARGSRDSEPPRIRARRPRIAASSPRKAGRSTPSRRRVSAGTPSSGSTSAASRCSASRTGDSTALGDALGGGDRLLGLLGVAIELHRGCLRVGQFGNRRLRVRSVVGIRSSFAGPVAGRLSRNARAAASASPVELRREDDAGPGVEVAEAVAAEDAACPGPSAGSGGRSASRRGSAGGPCPCSVVDGHLAAERAPRRG